MLLDRSKPENPNSQNEKGTFVDLFKSTTDNILYREEDANPDDTYLSCEEARKGIAELTRNPYLYNGKDYSMIPLVCFLCKKTGGYMTLRILARKNRIDMMACLDDSDAGLSFDEMFKRFTEEIERTSTCARLDQISVMKDVQKMAIEKIKSGEDIESGENILEEVKNE